jgi:hypothetical protein
MSRLYTHNELIARHLKRIVFVVVCYISNDSYIITRDS